MNRRLMIAGAVSLLAACGGDDDCHREQLQVQDVCTATTFAPGQPLEIDIATEMTDACAAPSCTVERRGGDIVVKFEVERCQPSERDAACDLAGGSCELPALDEGGYTLRVNGLPFGMIHVDAGSTATECEFF